MVEGMGKADRHATAPKSVKHEQGIEASRKSLEAAS